MLPSTSSTSAQSLVEELLADLRRMKHAIQRRGEIVLVLFDQETDAFQAAKCGMSFIHVADGRHFPQRLQSADAADAQNDFLLDSGVLIAAIQLGGDVAIVRAVLRDVAID